jgi:hypothetical protein
MAEMSSRAASINAFLQQELSRLNLDEVTAVEAARWLDTAGLLNDSGSRPGLRLRQMLRAGEIQAAVQRPPASHGRWFIVRADKRSGGRAPLKTLEASSGARLRSELNDDEQARVRARRRRERAARKYRPASVELLLLAEAPPAALERYFYFDSVATHDSLFRYVARGILDAEPTRVNKSELLDRLRDRGVFLIDLWRDPVESRSGSPDLRALVRRIQELAPERIIVIKTGVFDRVRNALLDAGLPLVDERIPFPGSGQQREFESAFARALKRSPARP